MKNSPWLYVLFVVALGAFLATCDLPMVNYECVYASTIKSTVCFFGFQSLFSFSESVLFFVFMLCLIGGIFALDFVKERTIRVIASAMSLAAIGFGYYLLERIQYYFQNLGESSIQVRAVTYESGYKCYLAALILFTILFLIGLVNLLIELFQEKDVQPSTASDKK